MARCTVRASLAAANVRSMSSDERDARLAAVTLVAAGIAEKLTRVLARHSIFTMADLCRTKAETLRAMDGIGDDALLSLRRTLFHHGLGLKDDPRPGTPEWDALGAEPPEEEFNYPWSH
jgi:hypothetical protein